MMIMHKLITIVKIREGNEKAKCEFQFKTRNVFIDYVTGDKGIKSNRAHLGIRNPLESVFIRSLQ